MDLHFVASVCVLSLRVPCRHAPMKKVNVCSEKGFRPMQVKLVSGEEVTCKACLALLRTQQFDPEALKCAINAAKAGESLPVPQDAESKPASEQVTADEGKKKQREKKNGKDRDAQEPQKDEGDQCSQFVKQFEPWIELLAPGSFGKKIPYRCKACPSKCQPLGKVGDLTQWKMWAVKHFLTQHCDTPKHINNVKQLEGTVETEEKVDCEALCIEDEDAAGKLFIYRQEFHLWASIANFQDNAKHKYWHDGNQNAWYIRSSECQVTTTASQDMGRNICASCLQLGAAHSASWFWIEMFKFCSPPDIPWYSSRSGFMAFMCYKLQIEVVVTTTCSASMHCR